MCGMAVSGTEQGRGGEAGREEGELSIECSGKASEIPR